MNNQLTTLSFSLYSNKGVYALLLGSGISRKAGIPTGWDVVIDLIRKLAAINNESCEPNPVSWFKVKYEEDPDYSTILNKLAQTPLERVNWLKQYFEATQEEQEQGLKQPTKAHKSIAKLIKEGYIKVVITTNFDRLLEKALQDQNIEPFVIRHSDDIDGALPLAHIQQNNVVIIKINGDYLDSRFLNTKNELEDYPEKLKKYVLQIINEFGLISCGWSGKWDNGLLNIIRQSENFRFNNFWTYINECECELNECAQHRKGKTLKIKDADTFLTEIIERVEALESINDNHPLNSDIAVARLKKYILREDSKILLHDLLYNEQEIVYRKIHGINDFNSATVEVVKNRIDYYEQILDTLLPLLINGVYWAKTDDEKFFLDILKRISEPFDNYNSYKIFYGLHYYPSLLVLYALGLAAIKGEKYSFLNELFNVKMKENKESYSRYINLIRKVTPCNPDLEGLQVIGDKYKLPLGLLISERIRPYCNEIIPSNNEFDEMFDIFEYIFSLNYKHLIKVDWCPYGSYKHKIMDQYSYNDSNLKSFFDKAEQEKNDWLPIKSGMFNGSYEEYKKAKQETDKFLRSFR